MYDVVLQDGFTALACASQEGHEQVVQLLMQAGACVDSLNIVSCRCFYAHAH